MSCVIPLSSFCFVNQIICTCTCESSVNKVKIVAISNLHFVCGEVEVTLSLIAHQRTRYRKVSLTVHGTDDQIGHGAAGAIVDGAVPVDGVMSVDGAVKTREEQGRRGRT